MQRKLSGLTNSGTHPYDPCYRRQMRYIVRSFVSGHIADGILREVLHPRYHGDVREILTFMRLLKILRKYVTRNYWNDIFIKIFIEKL